MSLENKFFCIAKIKSILSDSILPLILIMIAIITGDYYSTQHLIAYHPLQHILSELAPAGVFYWFTVTLPNYKKKEIAKKNAIECYIRTKKSIFMQLMMTLKKKQNNSQIETAINNYQIAREIISQNDVYILMNIYNKTLVVEVSYHLQQLDNTLAQLLFYEFVQLNKKLNERINHLRFFIRQFDGAFQIYSTLDNKYDEAKILISFIYEFLCGSKDYEGNLQTDNFTTLLRSA